MPKFDQRQKVEQTFNTHNSLQKIKLVLKKKNKKRFESIVNLYNQDLDCRYENDLVEFDQRFYRTIPSTKSEININLEKGTLQFTIALKVEDILLWVTVLRSSIVLAIIIRLEDGYIEFKDFDLLWIIKQFIQRVHHNKWCKELLIISHRPIIL